jgi:hypothetical protein
MKKLFVCAVALGLFASAPTAQDGNYHGGKMRLCK